MSDETKKCYVSSKTGVRALPERIPVGTDLEKDVQYTFPRYTEGEIHQKRPDHWTIWFKRNGVRSLFRVPRADLHIKESLF